MRCASKARNHRGAGEAERHAVRAALRGVPLPVMAPGATIVCVRGVTGRCHPLTNAPGAGIEPANPGAKTLSAMPADHPGPDRNAIARGFVSDQ